MVVEEVEQLMVSSCFAMGCRIFRCLWVFYHTWVFSRWRRKHFPCTICIGQNSWFKMLYVPLKHFVSSEKEKALKEFGLLVIISSKQI